MRRIAAFLVAVVLLAGCSGSPGGDATSGQRSVTLITHDSFDVSKSVLQEFEDRTGIQVSIVPTGDAGQEVSRAILTAGNPEGDVLYGIDDNLLAQGLEAGLFQPYTSRRLSAVPERYQLDPEHRVTPIDRGDVCVNVDDAWFQEHDLAPPATLADLAEPAYRSLLVVENPATSTPGLAFLLATIAEFGDAGWEDYWSRLLANDVTVVDGWERAYLGEFSGAGGGDGTHPLVVSYATSPVAEVVFSEPKVSRPPTSVMTSTCYRQIEFAGVLAGAAHPEEAGELVDFMISTSFQNDVPLKMFVDPVVDDATLPAVFVRNAVVVEHPLSIDPATVAAERAGWVSRWTDLALR